MLANHYSALLILEYSAIMHARAGYSQNTLKDTFKFSKKGELC